MRTVNHDFKRTGVSLLLAGLFVTLALSACQPVRPESEVAAAGAGQAEVVDTPAPTAEANRAEAQATLDEGIALYEDGDLKEALSRFDQAVEMDPSWADAYLGRSYVRFEAMFQYNDFDQIIPIEHDLSMAIKLDPSLAEAYCQRGRLHFMLAGQFFLLFPVIVEQGAADYGRYLELEPDGPCWEEAEQFLEIANDPNLEEMLPMIEGEIASATSAIEQNPQDLAAYWTRAMYYAALGDGEQAVRDLKTLIETGVESDSLSPDQLEWLEQLERDMDVKFSPLRFLLESPGL